MVQSRGYAYGLPLSYDSVHDEVFVKCSGLVVMTGNVWLFSEEELFELLEWHRLNFDEVF